jgi:hypothetical protein
MTNGLWLFLCLTRSGPLKNQGIDQLLGHSERLEDRIIAASQKKRQKSVGRFIELNDISFSEMSGAGHLAC